jgi:membrane protease YdiL (CAAX protease family)
MAGLFWVVVCLLLCAPKLLTTPRPIVLAALLYGLNELAVMVPVWGHALNFGLQFNWAGKLLSTLLSLVVIYGFKWVSPAEAGLVRPRPGSWRLAGLVVLAVSVLEFISGFSNRFHHPQPSLEAHLYQLLMPGIAEELFFRGTFLALLARAYPRSFPFLGGRLSWAGIVSLILFVLSHGLSFSTASQLLPHAHFTWGMVLSVSLWGTIFLWVRARSGSCLAAMAAHNLSNTALYLGWAFR